MFNQNNILSIQINLPQVLFLLFCLYGFFLPFEFILEYWFDIDTIFKPYRIVNLIIIVVFAIQVARNGITIKHDLKEDAFLYSIFAYGLVISLFRMMTSPFKISYFFNDLFQSGLYVIAFFIFKSLDLSLSQLNRIFQALLLGIILNAVYMIYNFSILGFYNRASGFMDNPNYVALSLVTALSYFLLKLDQVKKIRLQIVYIGIMLFLFYAFIIAGSRTGLILLILGILMIFFFVSRWKKVGIVVSAFVLVLALIPRDSSYAEFGGPLILVNRVMNKLDAEEEEDVRFFIWRGILNAMEETGYAGMGIGQFKANFSNFFKDETHYLILRIVDRGYFLSTHNDYLAILTDYGVIGLIFYLVFLSLSIRKRFALIINTGRSAEHEFFLTFCFILLSFIAVFGMAAENFQNQMFWFLLMFATKTPSHRLTNE